MPKASGSISSLLHLLRYTSVTWLALIGLGAMAASGQTVFSGSFSASGTMTDCTSTPPTWTETGTVTVTLTPAFSSLPASGGSVSGTFTLSGMNSGCTTSAASAQGTASGSVSASGAVTLTLQSSGGCSITLQGTVSEVSGALAQACFSSDELLTASSIDLTSRSAGMSGSSSSGCVPFPSGFIPFTSINYVTAANYNGDHLVVGAPSPGLLEALANLPLPAFANQTFCDAQVQLAPGQYYPSVYVPTADESGGNFSAFSGLLVDPATNLPYPNGIIPSGALSTVFAWRIGAAQVSSLNPNWIATGSMPEAMSMQSAVLLPSGKVLVAGPFGTNAYLYDPATGTFSTTGQMQVNHGSYLTATLLIDGRVLVVGGETQPSAAELYDPVSGQFTLTGSTNQLHGAYHTATLLNDGRVLVVGGLAAASYPPPSPVADSGAELFDPATGTFAVAGPMAMNRAWHTATLLADGRVLVAGGWLVNPANTFTIFDSAEVFDPSTGSFSLTLPMSTARAAHFAALLPSGAVLVGGGFGGPSVDLFDPIEGAFTPTGSCSSEHNTGIAVLLSSGQVLVVGGDDGALYTGTSSAELYSPATGTFTPTGSMTTSRTRLTATLLQDGRVLAAGGDPVCCSPYLSSAEIYTPTVEGLVTSQSGLTFQFAQGNSTAQSQSVAVLSTTTTIPWNASASTYEGGNWLSISTSSGNSVPGAAPTTLTITANPAGLSAQTYYGSACSRRLMECILRSPSLLC